MTAFEKANERRTYYVPEGESRTVKFNGGWWCDDNGTLLAPVTVYPEDGGGTGPNEPTEVVLKQYYADRLIRELIHLAPDPDDRVRVTRFEDGGWGVKLAGPTDAEDAM